ncbi:hypothetical protein [Mycobacterium colombiense]|uniref:hypothetical protein n=1 Tax=Mycobacterium colombiense TaxID=339268 RepID=UPI0012DB6E2A|nr:hypothetical protein [Mycobacterium colombiense]
MYSQVLAATTFATATVAALLLAPSVDAAPATTIPGNGTYAVGSDIQPGTYVSSNPGYCSWYRLSSLSGDGHIIASDNTASGKQYVTIAPSDVGFKTNSCSTWSLASMTPASQPSTTIPGDGTYAVGVDIQPGSYVSSNPGYCSWYRLSGFSGSGQIIASDNTASGKQYVTIAPSDVGFKTNSCATWNLATSR